MKSTVVRHIKRAIAISVNLLSKTATGRYIYEEIINNTMGRAQGLSHHGTVLRFSVPNSLNRYRVDTFSTKEPETLEWIDKIPKGSVVWDIGANVGLYTCYAAKARKCKVFAFEPSVFNLELLARNIFINNLANTVTIVPLPLAETLAASNLIMSMTTWGGAMSTFGQSYGHDGEPMAKVFEFPTIGLSMADAVNLLKIEQPDYIKMDVDGIEHLILKGGMAVLREVKGVLIEINDKFLTQANDASKYLEQAGLSLKEKRHADCFDSVTTAAKHTFNQIWSR